MEYARIGFGSGLGFMASFIVYIFIGMLFFIPGFILLKKEQKRKEPRQSMKILAYVLMAIGMIISLGMGSGTFFSELGGEF